MLTYTPDGYVRSIDNAPSPAQVSPSYARREIDMLKLWHSLREASYYYEDLADHTPAYRLLHSEYRRIARRLLHSSIAVAAAHTRHTTS